MNCIHTSTITYNYLQLLRQTLTIRILIRPLCRIYINLLSRTCLLYYGTYRRQPHSSRRMAVCYKFLSPELDDPSGLWQDTLRA